MTYPNSLLPTHSEVKHRAKTLRAHRQAAGHAMTHAQALERISRRQGYRDWNTLSAAITSIRGASCLPGGDSVSGQYMGKAFEAHILKIGVTPEGETRLTLRFDEAIDVVEHQGFSAFRKQINCSVSRDGHSTARLSDGTPHVALIL
jgi:hypothetical protein